MPTINSIDSNIPIEIAKGGTNATSMVTSTGLLKFDGTRLVTSSTALIDSSNRYTNSSQPAFSYYLNATKASKTGNGAAYVLGTDALTKIFDHGSNFSGTTFTAPITGIYFFNVLVDFTGGATKQTFTSYITATSLTYDISVLVLPSGVANDLALNGTIIASMSLNDTATFTVTCSGDSSNDVSIGGNATKFLTGVSGYLIC